jgi:hypothetical protein
MRTTFNRGLAGATGVYLMRFVLQAEGKGRFKNTRENAAGLTDRLNF